jgi:ribonuclease P protein component
MRVTRGQMTNIGRLLKRADFLRVQGAGKKWVTPTCIVQISESVGDSVSVYRYGLTIPKKIWKRAVDRNRVRRRVRAILLGVLADHLANTAPACPMDIVLLPRAPALTADSTALEKDIKWALKRLFEGGGKK